MKEETSIDKIKRINEITEDKTSKLQIINKGKLDTFSFDIAEMDHLIGSIEQYKRDNGRYPSEIIMNEEFGQRYFNKYQQGVAVRVLYKNKPMYITVNTRFRASEMLMR